MRVLCTQSRRVGDDSYEAGGEYEVSPGRAASYPAYFRALGEPEPAPKPDRVGTKKGLPSRKQGRDVNLDGTPVG